jgi:hypothetical protein
MLRELQECQWAMDLLLRQIPVDRLASNPTFYALKDRIAELKAQIRATCAN